jgi:2-C-methyl-D-erythritol 4-phosphate cytidylyltransferase
MAVAQRCWGVVPAAGVGSRMDAGLPKQYLQVAGATLLEHSVHALLANARLAGIVLAVHPQDRRAAGLPICGDPRVQRVVGGEQRSDSVLAALASLATYAAPQDWVLVHDAARPCLAAAELNALIERVISSGIGGILAEAVVDTVKRAGENGLVVQTLDRAGLWRAQTPQMFRLGELQAALGSAQRRGLAVTDEASAMELAGHAVQLVPGSPRNLKVTVPEDLHLAAWYLGREGVVT